MIRPAFFYDSLVAGGIDFFTGVPDSLLKSFCAYVTDHADERHHIIAANEGGAIGLATGYHFATGNIPLVYMQNSGEGNAVNPLLSLTDPDVYSVPLVLVICWRGMPGVHDEPQHVKQGKVTLALLDAMQIPYAVASDDEAELQKQLATCIASVKERHAAYALVIRKGTFSDYALEHTIPVPGEMTREEAIEHIMLEAPPSAAFVSTTGMASRELFELRVKHGMGHEKDFLTVGSMGHASQIALAIALQQPWRKVYCIDGDGAAIMHMGGMAIIGSRGPRNLVHIIMNNGAHDSVGGQPTVGRQINLPLIAKACGYQQGYSVSTPTELGTALEKSAKTNGLCFLEIKVKKGARKDLGRPTTTPLENKQAFMEFLQK